MSSFLKSAVVLAVVALVGCGGGAATAVKSGADASHRGSDHAEVGQPAPDLSIQSLNGKGKISLDALQGKILVVDFWATWCGPCKASFPQLEALSKKSSDRVVVVGISVDDERAGILDFARETGATFAIGWDEGHATAERWGVKNMPTTFIVDSSGRVRHIHAGYHDGETTVMEKELAALSDEGASGTRVAKNEGASRSESESATKEPDAPRARAKGEGNVASVASASSDESKSEATPPARAATPPKKTGAKKRGGGKTKHTKRTTKRGHTGPRKRDPASQGAPPNP